MTPAAQALMDATARLRGHNDAIEGKAAETLAGPYGRGYQKGVEAKVRPKLSGSRWRYDEPSASWRIAS